MSLNDKEFKSSTRNWTQPLNSIVFGFADEQAAKLLNEEGADLSQLSFLNLGELEPEVAALLKGEQAETNENQIEDFYGTQGSYTAQAVQVGEEDVGEDELDVEDGFSLKHNENPLVLDTKGVSLAGDEYDFESDEDGEQVFREQNVSSPGPQMDKQVNQDEPKVKNKNLQQKKQLSKTKVLPKKLNSNDFNESENIYRKGWVRFSEIFDIPQEKQRKRKKRREFLFGRKDSQHSGKYGRTQGHFAGTVQNMDIVSKIVEDDLENNSSFLNWNKLWGSKTVYNTQETKMEPFPDDLLSDHSVFAVELRNWEDEIDWDFSTLTKENDDNDEDVEWELADEDSNTDKVLVQDDTNPINVDSKDKVMKDSVEGVKETKDNRDGIVKAPLVANPLLDNSFWLDDDLLRVCDAIEGSVGGNVSLSHLIVNLNDSDIIFESWESTNSKKRYESASSNSLWRDDAISFNVSKDEFYDSPDKLIRHFVSHGIGKLEHASFWKQGVFLPRLPTDVMIEHFHRPKLEIPSNLRNTPLSLFYPCVGQEEITTNSLNSFESFSKCELSQNVILLEYGLEHTPVLVPLPGMASRLVKYTRLKTGDTKTKEDGHFSTNFFHNVYLAPDEPPPLCSGDVKPGQSVTILESSLFLAPAEILTPRKTDFLLTMKRVDNNSYSCFIRKIDHVITVGQTEPRMNVMAPNTDRFRKFVRDRVLLYVVLECLRIRREGLPLELSRAQVDEEFFRHSFPRSAVERTIKELAYLEKGVFKVVEPKEGFEVLRDMLLKSVTPEVLASYESMEYGWSIIQQVGIHMFTHPTAHGDLINAGEKAGTADGKEVADYIRRNLYRTPWYRAEEMIKLQKKQLREINRCLSRASIGNDLMNEKNLDSRIGAMTYPQLRSALIFHFHIPGRKIPTNVDHAREMVRRLARRRAAHGFKEKHKAIVEYHRAIIDGFKRFESTRKRAGLVPIEDQILALRDGRLDRVNSFMERFRRSIRSVRKGAIAASIHSDSKQGPHSGDDEKKALEDLSKERFLGPKRLPNLPEQVALVRKRKDPVTGEIHKVREIITDPERIQELLIKRKQRSRNNNVGEDNQKDNLKLNVSLKKLARGTKVARSEKRQRNADQSKASRASAVPAQRITLKYSGQNVVKQVSARSFREPSKRPPRKTPVQHLNDLFLHIEQRMENARGYNESVFDHNPQIRIFLVTEETPEDRKRVSLNLARPEDDSIGLDLVNPLDRTKHKDYFRIVDKEMNLSTIRQKCIDRKYRDVKEFIADIDLMLHNAEAFHSDKPSYWIIQHVELLKQVAEQEVHKYQNELSQIYDRIQNGRKGKQQRQRFANAECGVAEKRRRQRKAELAHRKAAEEARFLQNSMQANSSGEPASYSAEGLELERKTEELNDNESVHMSSNHIYEEGGNEQESGWEERES
ncbi:transcription initiation factor TFIID subunit D1 isoform 2 [Galdieria sulphuraria]|uniref:Transcription initiation factor TFIID subunit D1 isoform 2 n=1 Tax=Galdieria sulphuraria TaxID=130081 RepID=M2X7S1_GALSU|nr:transcription initiation factor TFIID subunit D1 isoform 2 [Galdieria sulphuraria]EME32595.1 transcription initiation factor TFIID subunit D1 isoform 2 [Galdieria sulphuraria]|eukprot:XP_005709115.1 transcription initiation factor TFIID subunit D1 isoform 2 [Galdieria sulphuraria]